VNALSVAKESRPAKNSGEQQKNSGYLGCFFAPKPPTIEDFCGERDSSRCKFGGKTA
jgi:hypothetical protein